MYDAANKLENRRPAEGKKKSQAPITGQCNFTGFYYLLKVVCMVFWATDTITKQRESKHVPTHAPILNFIEHPPFLK